MRAIALALLTLLPATSQERWKMQFFHDEDESIFQIRDIQFSSPTRGCAVGVLMKKGDRPQGHSVITTDGGAHWITIPLKEVAVSEFLLNDANAWLVTGEGVWFSNEGGRNWKKVSKQRGIQRVHFVSPQRGWAVGYPKLILKTEDGGHTWKKEDVVDSITTTPEYTSFNWITFPNPKQGVIAGRSKPPQKRYDSKVPLWMDPDATKRRETPSVTLLVQSADGGGTWKTESASLFGRITRLRSNNGRTIALIEYEDFFKYPSEIMRLDPAVGEPRIIYRNEKRLLTDVAFLPDRSALAVGIEVAGAVAHSPVPGPVKVMRSSNLNGWVDIPVDYRASATRVVLAAVDLNHQWIATDSGMILTLDRAAASAKQ